MSTNNGLVVHQLQPVSDTLDRERSHSASDFERLSIMDTTTDIVRYQDRDSNSISPPLPVMKAGRSASLTPQPVRKIPHYATIRRPQLRKVETVDTSNITREDHEVCCFYCFCLYYHSGVRLHNLDCQLLISRTALSFVS